jgi:hypothetical protein
MISRYGNRQTTPTSLRLAQIGERVGKDIIKSFNHRVSDLLLNPFAFGLPIIQCSNRCVTQARIVIAGVDHRDMGWQVIEKPIRQAAKCRQRNGENHGFDVCNRSPDVCGFCINFTRKITHAINSA